MIFRWVIGYIADFKITNAVNNCRHPRTVIAREGDDGPHAPID